MAQQVGQETVGALLVTLLPNGDPCTYESYEWRTPPPADCIEGRLGRPHLTWIFVAPLALIEIVVTSIIAMFPTAIGGTPLWLRSIIGASDPETPFEWKFVNYTPLLVGTVLILLYIYWHASVKKWFTGPIKQVELTASGDEVVLDQS